MKARYRNCPEDWEGWEDVAEQLDGDPEQKLEQAERNYEKATQRERGES